MSSVHEAEKLSLKGIAASLQASEESHFLGENRQQVYAWMEMGLRQQQSVQQGRRARGSAAALPGEDDRAQPGASAALACPLSSPGEGEAVSYRRQRFAQRYPRADIELLAAVDQAHDTLSGPATRRILRREYPPYGKPE